MLRIENRFDEYSYRVAYREADPTITDLDEGQWVTIVGGKVVISDGSKKSFLSISSKRNGRDQLGGKSVKKVSYLHGAFELSTDKFDVTKTYGDMTPLVVDATGNLKPFTEVSDKSWLIVAYSIGAPTNGFLRICSK